MEGDREEFCHLNDLGGGTEKCFLLGYCPNQVEIWEKDKDVLHFPGPT